MKSGYLSDEEVEAYLKPECRFLQMPDGTRREIQCSNIAWENFQIAAEHGPLSAEEITALAWLRSQRRNEELGVALAEVVVPLRRVANRAIDQKIAALKLRLHFS